MRPVVCIHGIGHETDATGYSDDLRAGVEALARAHGLTPPAWREVVWSDLSDLPGESLGDILADYARDVVSYDRDPSLRAAILERLALALDACPGAVLVAHSLGSVAAVDLLTESLHDVGALLTIGSPLGLSGDLVDYRRRALAAGALSALPWTDVWSPADPICTGHGLPWVEGTRGLQAAGYPCVSRSLDGLPWALAHGAYWGSPFVARWVLQMAGAE